VAQQQCADYTLATLKSHLKMSVLPKYTGKCKVGMMDLETSNLVVRLFYPSITHQNAEQVPWITSSVIGKGYASFLKAPKIVGNFFKLLTFRAKLDASWSVPVNTGKKFPVLVFSHGLGGCRNTYTSICGEMASHGMIVAAIEHNDGSASSTVRGGKVKYYEHPPSKEDAVLWPLRNKQLAFRSQEVMETIDLLSQLNDGDDDGVKYDKTATRLSNSIDMGNILLAGHSFGAATVINLVCKNDMFKAAIVLDPWMFPLDANLTTKTPLLSINSEKFHWKENFVRLQTFFPQDAPQENLYATIKGTAHQNQSDLPIVASKILQMSRMAGSLNPVTAIQINNEIMLVWLARMGFLEKHHSKVLENDHEHVMIGLENIMIHLGHA
jgi:platelet-activating factor acetylhydrolase